VQEMRRARGRRGGAACQIEGALAPRTVSGSSPSAQTVRTVPMIRHPPSAIRHPADAPNRIPRYIAGAGPGPGLPSAFFSRSIMT
jgi:hypothetical protein